MPKPKVILLSLSFREQLKREWINFRHHLLGKVSAYLPRGSSDDLFANIDSFCCFVGHGRSGSTLVGALLNAHPSVVLSNEINALRLIKNGLTASQICRLIYLVSQRQVRRGSPGGGGYSYAVDGQWQGKYAQLRVIGDRKAGATAYEISRDNSILDTFDKTIPYLKKFIHVVRNPFDVIATTYHKTAPDRGHDNESHLSREIQNYFLRCSTVRSIESRYGQESLHIMYHEKLLEEPMVQLREVCEFLDIEPLPDYLKACGAIVKESPNQTRHSLRWSSENMEAVKVGICKFPWLKDYGFDS